MHIIVKAGQGDGKTVIAGFIARNLVEAGFEVIFQDEGGEVTERRLPDHPANKLGLFAVKRIVVGTSSYPDFAEAPLGFPLAGDSVSCRIVLDRVRMALGLPLGTDTLDADAIVAKIERLMIGPR